MEKQTKALRSKRFKSGLTGSIANVAVALPESGLEGNVQLAVLAGISLTTICVIICQTITDVKSGGRPSGNYRPEPGEVSDDA